MIGITSKRVFGVLLTKKIIMANLTELNKKELISIEGGTFGYDAGWLLGNLIAGNFMSFAGQADAIMKYAVHYATE